MKPMKPMKKKSPLMPLSPQAKKIAGVSLVAFVAIGAIVLIAHQATPSASAAPAVKPAAVVSPPPEAPPAKAKTAKGKTANGATSAQVSDVVTLDGCLEQKDDTFRLKDTSGAEAPKSRSWKTGFLTKHPATVTVVDDAKRLKLANHVGERVSITGTLVEKELQGRSLRSVTASCE